MTIQLIIDSKFNSAGVKEAEDQVRQMSQRIQELGVSTGADAFISEFRGPSPEDVQAIEQQILKVRALAVALNEQAIAAAKAGNIQLAQKYQQEADSIAKAETNLRRLINTQEESNDSQQEGGSALDFINNKFNKFAFGLFVVQGAINTVTRLVRQMTDALIEGASIADRSNAFNILLEDAGVNAEALRASLIGASQGAVTLDAAMRPTLQLIKAGIPDAAGLSDKLLEIAVASAKLSGDLSQTEQIYTTLVRGIVRGSPRLIDNADIYLKLGDANEIYAASIGKTVEELTVQEQKMATLNAVLEQGIGIVDLAEQVDSTAITFQNLKTDAEEAGQALLSAVSTGVAGALEWFIDLNLAIGETTSALFGFSEETQEQLRSFREALAENPFSAFAQSVIVGATAVSEIIRFAMNTIKEFGDALVAISYLGLQVQKALTDVATGVITLDEAMQRLSVAADAMSDTITDGLDASEEWSDGMETINAKARDAAITLGLVAPEMDEIAESARAAAAEQDRLSSSFNQLSAGIQAAIEARTGLDAQYRDKKTDIEEDIRDKVLDINEDLAEKLGDINADLRDKLIDLGEKYKEDVTNLAEETAEELQEIEEDLAEKLADISDGSQKDRQEAVKDRNKAVEDAHEDHQKKLLDIERKYEAARLKALIDRDARALFEAEQNRKTEREEAQDDLDEKVSEEEEKLKEQMEKINELEEERRKDAIEAAEKRRRDALEAQAKELQDLKDALAKQKAEAKKAALEQQMEARKDAQERRQDAQEHYRDALQDLDEWYREQLLRQKEANLQRKINELEHLEEMGELTQAHLDELRGMWNDYNGFVSGAAGGSTPGGVSGGGGGISGITSGGGGSGGGGAIAGITGGRGNQVDQFNEQRRMNLQINSNDKMLEDVLRSSTYDFMIEALDE